jgi:hypothetical protein
MSTPILATKLYIPPTLPSAVPRDRLVERLDEGLRGKLTLIAAPAGFGKTTLVGGWAAGYERPVAWLSLDEGVRVHPQAIARVTGVLFLITFLTSIPAYFFYVPVLDDPRYVVGGGADLSVQWGAFLELLLIVANIGTAIVLFPVLKRVNEILALGYVTARLVECTFIAIGILSLLTAVTLRQGAAAGAEAGSLVAVGGSLVSLHEWTRLLGPGFVVGIGNGLMLGYLMYSSRLMPRGLAMLGLIGGPLIIASGVAVLLGIIEAGSIWQAIATIPEFFWELSIGIWLTIRGFNPSAVASLTTDTDDGVMTGVDQTAILPSNGTRAPTND